MSKFFKEGFQAIFEEFGYRDSFDFITSVLGFQNFFVAKIQILLSVLVLTLININSFIDKHIWSPPVGLFVIVVLIILRAITGFLVKKRHQGQKYNIHKGFKNLPVLLAHVGMLSIAFQIGKSDAAMIWLPTLVFVVFATAHFLLLGKDLVKLGYLEGDTWLKLSKKIEDKTDLRDE